MQNIDIAVVSDNNLAFAIATLFINLLEVKNNDTFLNLHVILSPDFLNENIEKIKIIERDNQGKCKINIIRMEDLFDNYNGSKYISKTCAYKMCLAETLPNLDKILYLDLDTIVFEDLFELFNTDIKDYYAAGVFSINQYCKRSHELPKKLNIPDLTTYVNAGVILYNLRSIRKNKINEKMQALIGAFDDSVDQHIFNKVCHGKIKLMPYKYNVTQSNDIICKTEEFLYAMRECEYIEGKQRPVIYHYSGYMKPWEFSNLKYSVLWQRYYNKTAWKDTIIEYKKLDWTLPFSVRQ